MLKLQKVVAALKRERDRAQKKLAQLNAALAALASQTTAGSRVSGTQQARKRKPLSASARRRIAAAQRARWAKWKASHPTRKS